MKEKFSYSKYVIELRFIKRLDSLNWWEFGKRANAYEWRQNALLKLKNLEK